jgi:hypothetical protein
MAYIQTVAPEDAGEELRRLYEEDLESQGYVANHTMALSLRPKAIAAWRALSGAVRAPMSVRRYELVTIAAAIALKSTY